MSLVTRAWVQGSAGSTITPGGHCPMPEDQWSRPAVPGYLGPGRRARRVDQNSRATQALARGPVVSTISPRGLGFGSKSPWFTSSPRRLGPVPVFPQGQPAVSGDSGPGPKTRGVDQLSRATCTWVRWPLGSTSSPGLLGPGFDGLRFRPAIPGASGTGPRACENDLPS